MNRRITTHIPDPLLPLLTTGCPSLLLTIGRNGFPDTAYTWTVVIDAVTVHFGVDHGSTSWINLERNRRASLQIIEPDNIEPDNLIYLIKGEASLIKRQIEATLFDIALMSLAVAEVKDQTWPGVRVLPLAYEWDPEHRSEMLAMERAVYREMREWKGRY